MIALQLKNIVLIYSLHLKQNFLLENFFFLILNLKSSIFNIYTS